MIIHGRKLRGGGVRILMQDGHYLMALKDNQPILKKLVESKFKATATLSTQRTEENLRSIFANLEFYL